MVSGKLCSKEFHKWVLLVLEFVEKHDKGSGQNLPDHDLYQIFVDVVLHWQQIPHTRGSQWIEIVIIPIVEYLIDANAGRGFFPGLMMTRIVVHLGGHWKKFNEIVAALCRNRTIKRSKYHQCNFWLVLNVTLIQLFSLHL